MASRNARMHGRIDGANARCAVPGCMEPGEFKAPIRPASFDSPGLYRLLCLDHVREHNASYNFFDGMSADEITEAQTPYGGWERQTRAFAAAGSGPAPAWSDFADPLEAIAGRFGARREQAHSRFTREERRALSVLGLGEAADRAEVRKRYGQLLQRYHPDRNRGDRSQEQHLRAVIEAYQTLRKATALA